MRNPTTTQNAPVQSLPVFRATDFCVTDGANLDDPLSYAGELMLDDTYTLDNDAAQTMLAMGHTDGASFVVANGSIAGTVKNRLLLDCVITLIGPDGTTFDAVVIVELAADADEIEDIYLFALAALSPMTSYRLVGIDPDKAHARMAEVACVSFTRGTCITMASGQQRPIEDLHIGDKVLSRDDGPQIVRWIGQTTMRAVGDFAPVLISKGTLNNENDLVVSPNHRLFIYQRVDEIGAGRSEVLVKAKHLINGDTVTCVEGGFVDYFQLLFDDHQIIFAEGIAAESMLLDQRTTPALPDDLTQDQVPMHTKRAHEDFEIDSKDTARSDIAERLRRSSST